MAETYYASVSLFCSSATLVASGRDDDARFPPWFWNMQFGLPLLNVLNGAAHTFMNAMGGEEASENDEEESNEIEQPIVEQQELHHNAGAPEDIVLVESVAEELSIEEVGPRAADIVDFWNAYRTALQRQDDEAAIAWIDHNRDWGCSRLANKLTY